jgi:FKBP-type peptidyl-prolyl cis-trans isomerase
MRIALACLLAAGLAVSVSAQDSKSAGDVQPAAAPAAQPDAPPAPKGIPVPDGPVVKKTELEGGLIVEDIKIGEGYEIKPKDMVIAHYHGTLKDGGKKFDSSFERGEPIAFPLDGVIEGWQKGVPGMKVGGIRRLTIPSKMGYGERGAGADIPANADLVFIIEMVDALRVEDVKVGEGEAATGMCIAVVAQTIKDASGKETQKNDAAKPAIWISSEFQPLSTGLEGMKVGGKRIIHVPKQLTQANPQFGGNWPTEGPITMEFELLSIRNLPSGRGGR